MELVSVYINAYNAEKYASPKDFKTYFDKIDEIIEKRAKFFQKEL